MVNQKGQETSNLKKKKQFNDVYKIQKYVGRFDMV